MFLDYIIQIYASKSFNQRPFATIWEQTTVHRCQIRLGYKLLAIVQFQGLNLEPSCEIQVAIWPAFVILYRRDGLQDGEMKIFLVSHYLRLVPQWCINCGEQKALIVLISYPLVKCLFKDVMPFHMNRPQPAWDRTCTAAAAAGLLWELNLRPELSTYEFEKQAEAVECSLDILLDALTTRRVRLGRSITRKQRHNRNI